MCQARSDSPDNVFFMASNTPCPKCDDLEVYHEWLKEIGVITEENVGVDTE